MGLRPAEEAEYEGEGDFGSVEATYRRGFESALRARGGVTFEDARERPRREHGPLALEPAFRRGFERGIAYDRKLREGPAGTPR